MQLNSISRLSFSSFASRYERPITQRLNKHSGLVLDRTRVEQCFAANIIQCCYKRNMKYLVAFYAGSERSKKAELKNKIYIFGAIG